jgi:CRISPR-associated protein Csb3
MSFSVRVDVRNPGQFFACCGLFELASRMSEGAVAHFETERFIVEAACSLDELLDGLTGSPLGEVEPEDSTASPIELPKVFRLRLDWWKDAGAGGRDLKVWAGTMQSLRIAQAMVTALREPAFHSENLLDVGCVVYDPADATAKVEPFYFDARRTPNAHSRDVGFSPNDLGLTTTAFPAVEALCLVGLQRCRPAPLREEQRRVFRYSVWLEPLPVSLLAAVVSGTAPTRGSRTFEFENWYRTGQRKHKAFRYAVPITKGE